MPVAWIPSLMQKLTEGQQQIEVEGEIVLTERVRRPD